MNQTVKFGLILGLICLMATLVLSATYEITKPKIDEQLRREEQAALKAILPEADSFDEKMVDGIDYFEGRKGDEVIGYCVKIVASGYSGYIRIIAGIDPKGTIKGVRILEHYETPGLGAKINEIRPGEDEPWFLRQFVGRSVDAIAIKKEIDAVTGATISSKAVSDAINKTISEFLRLKR